MPIRARSLALVVALVATIGCDRVTKSFASDVLANSPERSFLGDTVRLTYVENAGGFLSLGAQLPPRVRVVVFTGGVGIALLALTLVALSTPLGPVGRVGMGLFVAGGLSNWIDRVLRGSVVDFMNVGVGGFRTGIFNVADVAIMIGVGLFIVSTFYRCQDAPCCASRGPNRDV